MKISLIPIENIAKINQSFCAKKLINEPIVDSFEVSDCYRNYEKNLERLSEKLTAGSVEKADLDEIVEQYPIEDREIVKEIFCESAPILTYGKILESLKEIQSISDNDDIEKNEGFFTFYKKISKGGTYISLDSNLLDLIGYFTRRNCLVGDFYHIKKANIDEFLNKKDCQNSDRHYIADGIFNRKLTDEEIDALSNMQNLIIINLNNFELMPNFIDFTISKDKVKQKINSLIPKVKQIRNANPELSIRDAIKKANDSYLKENLKRLEEARRIKGFDTRYSYIESKCINYEDIDKHLSCTIERPKTPLPKNLTLEEIMEIKSAEMKKPKNIPITPSNLKESLENSFDNPQEIAQALASNEFTYFTPKGFTKALKILIKKLKEDLKQKNLDFKNCVFIYTTGKSDAFIGYLLEEMGEITKEQRLEIPICLNKEIPEDKIIVFIDDILGSGETAINRLGPKSKNLKYCLTVISAENGRNRIKKRATQIDYMQSRNAFDSKYKAMKKDTKAREFDVEDNSGNTSEMFYFSYPDNCCMLVQKFASKVLKMEYRK